MPLLNWDDDSVGENSSTPKENNDSGSTLGSPSTAMASRDLPIRFRELSELKCGSNGSASQAEMGAVNHNLPPLSYPVSTGFEQEQDNVTINRSFRPNSSTRHPDCGRSPGNRLPRVRSFVPSTGTGSSVPRLPSTPLVSYNSFQWTGKESRLKTPPSLAHKDLRSSGDRSAMKVDLDNKSRNRGCFSCGHEGHKSLDCPCPAPSKWGWQSTAVKDDNIATPTMEPELPERIRNFLPESLSVSMSMNSNSACSDILSDECDWRTNTSPAIGVPARAAAGQEASPLVEPQQQNNLVTDTVASFRCSADNETQTQKSLPERRRFTRGGGRRRGRSKSKAPSDHDARSNGDGCHREESTRRASSRRSSRRAPSSKRLRGFEQDAEFPDNSVFRTPRTPRGGRSRIGESSANGSASSTLLRSQDVQLDSTVSQTSLNLARQWIVRNCTLCVRAETSCGLLYARYLEAVRSPCMPPASFKNFLRDSFGIMMKLSDSGAWIACGLSLNNGTTAAVGMDLMDSQSITNASETNFPASASVCASTSDPNAAEARRLLHRLLSYPELRQATQKVDSKLFDDIFALLLGCTSI